MSSRAIEGRLARLEQQAGHTANVHQYTYIFCDRSELPDPLDDAAIEVMIAAGTATRMGPVVTIRGKRLTAEEWIARNA